jgi:hypothetical protein
MRLRCVVPLVTGLVLGATDLAQAQERAPVISALSVRFESWRTVLPIDSTSTFQIGYLADASKDRGDQVLLGGAIGAAAGVVACTAISTLIDDNTPNRVLSFCPLDTYLLFAAGGFVVGALVGWLI